MGELELREKYGGKLAKAINRASCAEIPGGNDALDKLTHLADASSKAAGKSRRQSDSRGRGVFQTSTQCRRKNGPQIREKWQIPPEEKQQAKTPPPPQSKPGGPQACQGVSARAEEIARDGFSSQAKDRSRICTNQCEREEELETLFDFVREYSCAFVQIRDPIFSS